MEYIGDENGINKFGETSLLEKREQYVKSETKPQKSEEMKYKTWQMAQIPLIYGL